MQTVNRLSIKSISGKNDEILADPEVVDGSTYEIRTKQLAELVKAIRSSDEDLENCVNYLALELRALVRGEKRPENNSEFLDVIRSHSTADLWASLFYFGGRFFEMLLWNISYDHPRIKELMLEGDIELEFT